MDWFETIRRYYTQGLWTAEMVRGAVLKGAITADEYREITGKEDTL